MITKLLPDVSLVRGLLSYEPATGVFLWRERTPAHFDSKHPWEWKKWNAKYANQPAGSLQRGYIKINLGGDMVYAHRLAWLLSYGEPVPPEIDHINGNRTDNRIANLRGADRSGNSRNSGIRRDNTTGAKGVTFDKATGKFRVTVSINGKHHRLGRFVTLKEAVTARREAAERLHGEFARHD